MVWTFVCLNKLMLILSSLQITFTLSSVWNSKLFHCFVSSEVLLSCCCKQSHERKWITPSLGKEWPLLEFFLSIRGKWRLQVKLFGRENLTCRTVFSSFFHEIKRKALNKRGKNHKKSIKTRRACRKPVKRLMQCLRTYHVTRRAVDVTIISISVHVADWLRVESWNVFKDKI